MSAVNRINKYNLEDRARELNEKTTSLRDIADILTKESGHQISKDSVFSFLKTDIKYTSEIVEKKVQLKAKVAEAEISTINHRLDSIQVLMNIALKEEEDSKTKIFAVKTLTEALDSLDKRLGQVAPDSQTVINITQNNLTLKDKIQRYREMGILNGS